MVKQRKQKPLSPNLQRMVATLSQYYPSMLIDCVLDDADTKAIERGGRQITVADWDGVLDDQPIEGGYKIVSSPWVDGLVMLMEGK